MISYRRTLGSRTTKRRKMHGCRTSVGIKENVLAEKIVEDRVLRNRASAGLAAGVSRSASRYLISWRALRRLC